MGNFTSKNGTTRQYQVEIIELIKQSLKFKTVTKGLNHVMVMNGRKKDLYI